MDSQGKTQIARKSEYELIAHAGIVFSRASEFAVLASKLRQIHMLSKTYKPGEARGGRGGVSPVSVPDFTVQPERHMPEEFQSIKLKIDGGVARLTLDRPEHNLLNEAMLRELADGITFAGEQDEVKLIVIDSACKVFCGGIDIGEYTSQRVFQMLDAFHAAFSGMLEVGKPVICVVNGPAIGGGAELAAFGDLVIATPRARFAQPEISIGVFPPLASTILPFLVGPKTALELVLTGEAVTAERALELGLVNRLVPEAQLEKTVEELVSRIAAHSGPVLTMAKKAILGGMGLSLREGLKHSMNIFLNELYRLEDSQEGLRALVEKRKPNWKNR
jgi:cyclohexa-1,5-dienecarbonyl-CoA hydratase